MFNNKEYLDYVLEQLSGLGGITYRAMMGEYILYYNKRVVGGIYDDRLLVKPVPAAKSYLRTLHYETPYDGAKEMLLVEDVDDRAFLQELFVKMLPELPAPKVRHK